jgi:hypothetical protein
MANYCDYITLADYRSTYQGSPTANTGNDTLILQLIKSVAREVEQGGRWYYPRIESRSFDRVGGRQLDFSDWDLLELTTFLNGDGSTITPAQYDLLPYNYAPYYAVRTKLTSGIVYLVDTSGNSEKALTLTGVGGFSKDYTSAWQIQASLTGVLTPTGTALAGLTSGEIHAGQLLKLGAGNDYAYVSATPAEPATSATLIRSVNGSTGVSHAASDPIYVWTAGADFELLCKEAVMSYSRLKDNPMGERLVLPGIGTFSTPKDVGKWITQQLKDKGYVQPY